MRNFLLILFFLFILKDCLSQNENIKMNEIKEIKIYAYPFDRELRLETNPKTIKKASLLELKLKNILDPWCSIYCEHLIDYLNEKQKSKSQYLPGVRMLIVLKLKRKKKLKIFICKSNKAMIKDIIFHIEDRHLKNLIAPLNNYFKPLKFKCE